MGLCIIWLTLLKVTKTLFIQDLALTITGGRHKINVKFRRKLMEDAGRYKILISLFRFGVKWNIINFVNRIYSHHQIYYSII